MVIMIIMHIKPKLCQTAKDVKDEQTRCAEVRSDRRPFGGRGAEVMEKLSDEEIALTCRDIFRKFLNDPSIPAPDLVLRSSWISDPLYCGAYSYLSIDSRETDIEDLGRPLPSIHCPKLQFAGEATHPQYFSTVHGAFLSGVRESRRIQEIYQ